MIETVAVPAASPVRLKRRLNREVVIALVCASLSSTMLYRPSPTCPSSNCLSPNHAHLNRVVQSGAIAAPLAAAADQEPARRWGRGLLRWCTPAVVMGSAIGGVGGQTLLSPVAIAALPAPGSELLAQAPSSAPNPPGNATGGAPLMQQGVQGPGVEAIQRKLAAAGYYEGAVSGNYDATTADAVLWFQTVNALPPTGQVDFATWNQIQASLPNSAPERRPTAEPTPPDPEATAPDSSSADAADPANPAAPADPAAEAPETPEPPETPATPIADPPVTTPFGLGRSLPELILWGIIAVSSSIALIGSVLYLLRTIRRSKAGVDPEAASEPIPVPRSPKVTVTPPPPNPPPSPQRAAPPPPAPAVPAPQNGARPAAVAPEPGPLQRMDIHQELITALDSPDAATRRKAIWELGQRGQPQAIQPLVDLMMESDSRQRNLILAALAEIGGRTMQPMGRALALSLQDPNPDVRKNAIRDLTHFYDVIVQMQPLLQHAAADPNPDVRQTAQWALQKLQDYQPALPPEQLKRLSELSSSEPPSPDRDGADSGS